MEMMSLLALLFSYNAISGERERGTLNLMMSNAVPRSTLLLGKYIGSIVSLLLPFCISFTVVLLVIQGDGITFSKEEFIAISLVFLISLIFVSLFFTLGMLFSTVAQESATALMFSLFSWVMLAMIIPNASVFIASQLRDIAPKRQLISQENAIWDEFSEKISLYKAENEPKQRTVIYNIRAERGAVITRVMRKKIPQILENVVLHRKPTPEEIKSIERKVLRDIEWRKELFAYSVPLRIDYADKVGQLYQRHFSELEEQANLAITFSRISPFTQLSNVISAVAQTDLATHMRFLNALRQYRRQFIRYLEEKTDKFFSIRWFNDEENIKWFNDEKEAGVDIADMPRFELPRESFPSALKRGMIDIVLLFTLNILFFMGAYVYFLKSDLK